MNTSTNHSSEVMVDRLRGLLNRDLTEDETTSIYHWQKGRALQQTLATAGWEVVVEMLQSYAETAIQDLLSTDPANERNVIANHAVAFAANRIFRLFLDDVQ